MTRKRMDEMNDREFSAFVQDKRKKRMAAIDKLPPAIRELVHDYGYNVVDTAMRLGIKKPKQIRHMVETVLNEFSPTRGNYSSQGRRAQGNLDQ